MIDQLCAVSVVSTVVAEASTCATNTFRRPQPRDTLSKQLWSVDLTNRLPRVISQDGTQVTSGELPRIQQFLSQYFSCLQEAPYDGALRDQRGAVKQSYLTTVCDLFELRHNGRTVGALVGAPEDWSTYYVRSFAMAPDFQKRALIRRFVRECLFEPLADCGVQRVTADTSPANRAMGRLLGELKFYVTGQQLSERWGSLVRYTKFLDASCEAAFLRSFGTASP
jgi:RimJ/RimL family protein N-acetyltransferase